MKLYCILIALMCHCGGAVVGASNSVVAQTGKNFAGFNEVNWNQVGISSAIGGVAGAAGGAAGYYASNASFLVNGISSPVLRSAVVSPLASGAGHVAGGTAANLFAGQKVGDAFYNSFDGIGQSMAIGTAIGVSATIATSYASGRSPWTGKEIWPKNNGFAGKTTTQTLQPGDVIDRYGGTRPESRFFSPEGVLSEQRSLSPSTNLSKYDRYQVVKPFNVQSGIAAPWFGQPGGGIQYYSPYTYQYLINNGFIIKY